MRGNELKNIRFWMEDDFDSYCLPYNEVAPYFVYKCVHISSEEYHKSI